jgi:hypothetical protein
MRVFVFIGLFKRERERQQIDQYTQGDTNTLGTIERQSSQQDTIKKRKVKNQFHLSARITASIRLDLRFVQYQINSLTEVD